MEKEDNTSLGGSMYGVKGTDNDCIKQKQKITFK